MTQDLNIVDLTQDSDWIIGILIKVSAIQFVQHHQEYSMIHPEIAQSKSLHLLHYMIKGSLYPIKSASASIQ